MFLYLVEIADEVVLVNPEAYDNTHKVDNRMNIMDSAEHLFYTKGYDAVGVQEVARESGVTKPTLYYYFKSKYGLLECLLTEKFTVFNQMVEEAAVDRGDLVLTLNRTASVYLEYTRQYKEFYFLCQALFFSARENEAYRAVKPYMNTQYTIIKNIFYHAEKELGNMNGRQEQFAAGFIGILNTYLLVIYESQEEKNTCDSQVAASLVRQFMYGIYS